MYTLIFFNLSVLGVAVWVLQCRYVLDRITDVTHAGAGREKRGLVVSGWGLAVRAQALRPRVPKAQIPSMTYPLPLSPGYFH